MSKVINSLSELSIEEKDELLEWMCKDEVLRFMHSHLLSVIKTDHDDSTKQAELWSKIRDIEADIARHHGSRRVLFGDKLRSVCSGITSVDEVFNE